jgi:hypothetical protein
MGGIGMEMSVSSLSFEGVSPGFAARAVAAFEASVMQAGAVAATPRDLGLLVLDGLDFSTPERLGESLAQAILQSVAG